MPTLEDISFEGGTSPFANKGIRGAAKFTSGVDLRKAVDTLSCQQALIDEGLIGPSHSSSPSLSPSASISPSSSASASASRSKSFSASVSPSASSSRSASVSASPSGSASPSSSVSPSLSPSAGLNNVYVDLVLFWVKCTDGNTYGFGNAGNVYRRFSDGFTRNVYKDPDGGIRGAEEKPSSSGGTYLQWATATAVKQKPIPGSSDWSDVTVVAENLTGEDWHTMRQVGGANYICNGSKIALVGYDDSWTNEALDLIPGNLAKAIVERNGRAVIGTYRTGYPNKGVNAMIDTEVPLCQIGNDGELFFANFTDSMPVRRFPGGGRVNPGGVANEVDQIQIFDWEFGADSWIDKQTLGNMSLWGVFDADTDRGGIYTFGRKLKDQPFILNLEYALDVDEIGAVTNVDGVTICSYRDGSDFGTKAVDSAAKASGVWESLEWKAPAKKPVDITVWKVAEVEMAPLPANCSVSFYYKMDKASAWTLAYTADGSASYSTTGGTNAVFRIGAKGKIYERKLVLTPYLNTTPEVYKVTTLFE